MSPCAPETGNAANTKQMNTNDLVLVTGAGGFIGGHLVAELRRRGHRHVRAVDVKPFGPNSAREIGTFSLKTKGATPQEMTGKFVVLWEKVGNDWKLAVDMWNDGK